MGKFPRGDDTEKNTAKQQRGDWQEVVSGLAKVYASAFNTASLIGM